MFFVTVIILLLGGVLGAASIIVAKKPDAQDLIDKLTPYQGSIGILMFIWGIWDIFNAIRYIGLLEVAPLLWIVLLVSAATELLLGFLLGFGLLTKYALSKNEAAMEKGQAIRGKLTKFQGPLGVTAVILAVVLLVLRFTM